MGKTKIISFVVSVFITCSLMVANLSSTASAACTTEVLFGIPTWYRGLVDDNCEIMEIRGSEAEKKFVAVILLNISDMISRVIGILTVGFIIYGGVQYILATGEPSKVASAKKTITNAIIGLIICILSVAIVNFMLGIFS